DPKVLRGMDADIIHFEEACLLPDEASYRELVLRLSGRKGKLRQLIMTTNPEGGGGWITETFKLAQLRDDFRRDKEELSKPCCCHLCSRCLVTIPEEYVPEYEDGICPKCQHVKDNECPGNQEFVRVI